MFDGSAPSAGRGSTFPGARGAAAPPVYHPAVNFLLLEPNELDPHGVAVVRGRRAQHVTSVLRAGVGNTLRIGVVGGSLGSGLVDAVDEAGVRLVCTLGAAPPLVDDVLFLAVPRPKVLLRMLAHAAALGFARIVLFRSWRVEKSHLDSTAMRADVQRQQLLLGLEQAGRTSMPTVEFHALWKPMVEDALPTMSLPARRFCGHPNAAAPTHELSLARGEPFALAIGPDGGFTDYEIAGLRTNGFLAVSAGPSPLRTETALAVLTGQLDLLRRRGSVPHR